MKIKRIMFLFCFLLIVFFTFSLSSTCYGAESIDDDKAAVDLKVFNSPECNLRVSKYIYNHYKYVLIITSMGNYYPCSRVLFSNYELYYNPLNGSLYASGEFYYKDFDFVKTNFKDISSLTESDFEHYTNPYAFIPNTFLSGVGGKGVTCHSTFDVYSYDKNNGKGDLVFQAAPQKVGLSINFSEVITNYLTILPAILITLIGILSLRKTIRLLLQMLRKA